MASEACCESGAPVKGTTYDKEGKFLDLADGLPGYVCGSGSTAVIIFYDIFGWNKRNENVFMNCDELANSGYFVVMPDFYRGNPWPLEKYPPPDKSEFGKWWSDVADEQKAIDDTIKLVLPYLRKQNVNKISIIGYCWGGLITMNLASNTNFTGAISIHGARLTPELMEKIRIPVAIFPGANDGDFEPLKEVLDKKTFGQKCVYKKYGSQHGFMVARGDWSISSVKNDRDDAMKKTKEFFANLGLETAVEKNNSASVPFYTAALFMVVGVAVGFFIHIYKAQS